MRSGGSTTGGLWLALLAFAGLLGGHLLSYAVIAPHGHERTELLRVTGHGLQDLFGPLAIAALIAAAVGFIGSQLRSDPRDGDAGRAGPRRPAVALWVMQTLGFVALEATERALSSHPVTELVREPAFLVGLVAQLFVALAGTLLIAALRRTAEVIRRLMAWAPPSQGAVERYTPATSTPRSSFRHYSWSLRGPPLS